MAGEGENVNLEAKSGRDPIRCGSNDDGRSMAEGSLLAPAKKTLWSFLYASCSAIEPAHAEAEVAKLAAHAADRNRVCAITGALVFCSGHFAQVLEGPYIELDRLINDIAADTRHTDFVALQYLPIKVRRFAGWSLVYSGRSKYVQRSILLPTEQAKRGARPKVKRLLSLIEEFSLQA